MNDYNFFFIYFLICIFTDIGGYIFGKVFKGPKLTKISPNKTYSGVIGGFFLSIIFFIFLNYLIYKFILLFYKFNNNKILKFFFFFFYFIFNIKSIR